jgi:penicillin G amidase
MPCLPRWLILAALMLWTMSPPFVVAQTKDELLARAKGVLAQLDGEIRVPGLRQPVHVLRDEWGIPHIYAENQHDLFFAQGYVTAQDRLFQIDLWRRIGLGETAELFGAEAIEADHFARLIKYRGDMQAEWASYGPDTQEIATSFVAGINAYIDHLDEKLPIEFQVLNYRPAKWKPEDILARMSGIIMTSNWQREVARARLIATVGHERARTIAPTDPQQEYAPAPGIHIFNISPDILKGYAAATRPLKFPPSTTESNNWVIAGALSASGKPLLANDPHRAIALPSLRYLIHLHAPGWNVIGSGEPALPGVAVGHNERIAWGFTIVGTDQSDIYVEETKPEDPRQYKVGDRWEQMEIVRESLPVRGRSEPATLDLCYTRHGPVVYRDEAKNVAFALKWVGAESGGAAYLGSLSVARATNRQQFLDSLAAWKLPCQNMVYADVDGNIGWMAIAATPIRRGWDGLLPVPGGAGEYEWQGYRDINELPQSFNPPRGWIATANHNILPAGYQHAISYEWASPHRFLRIQERIEERIAAGEKFTSEECQSIQHENTSLPGRALIEVLRSAELPKELGRYSTMLTSWNGVLSRDSQAGPLYAVWLQELMNAFYADRLPKEARTERGDLRNVTLLLKQLSDPQREVFGDRPAAARDELVRTTFAAAVQRTKKLLGDDPSGWSWGKLHTVTFEHPLASLGPAYAAAFNAGPVGRPGDVHTPNNTRHDENFRQVHGASYRQVFDLADWDRGVATSVPGQSGQPGSPHYNDLLPLWAEGKYFPLMYSRPAVEKVTRHRLTLRP